MIKALKDCSLTQFAKILMVHSQCEMIYQKLIVFSTAIAILELHLAINLKSEKV